MAQPRRYEVKITPLISDGVYGSEIDVSDFLSDDNISQMKSETDASDFNFGVFVYDSITVKLFNKQGKFNDSADSRSIFTFIRDRAKFKVSFFGKDGADESISFNGLLNEESSRFDVNSNVIKFKILSLDSIIRNSIVAGSTVPDSTLFSTAIKSIINTARITSVLTFDASKIEVANDLTVDDGSFFDNLNTKKALDSLLLASNSIFTVDKDTSTMVVKGRDDHGLAINTFYGAGDLQGRESIIDIRNYNTGFHRTFNTMIVNGTKVFDSNLVASDGSREKEITLGFITDSTKASSIGTTLLNEFKNPKIEMEIIVKNSDAKALSFLDLISVDFPSMMKPQGDGILPIYDVAKYDEDVYPLDIGSLTISPDLAFKIIGIREDPRSFLTTMKIRQRGTGASDGNINSAASYYDLAIYDENVYTDDENEESANNNTYGGGTYDDENSKYA